MRGSLLKILEISHNVEINSTHKYTTIFLLAKSVKICMLIDLITSPTCLEKVSK